MPSSHFQFSVLGLQFAVLLAFAAPALSQSTFPSPTLISISPLGGKPGSSVELTLRGADLDGPQSILLNERVIPLKSLKPNIFSIALPADLKPALYDLRFVGHYGVSNPRVFEISALDSITSPGTNAKPDQALKVAVGSVIQGAFKSNSPQWFTFEAKKGQSIIASYDGHRFDTRTEISGAITNTSGKEIARMRHGVMPFVPPADGTYRLRLNDLMYRTGDDYAFRVTLDLMKLAPLSGSPYGPHPVPPISVKIGDVIRDQFPEQGQPRMFDLAFKAGDQFILEVHSQQLGHSTDPHLVIENLKPDGTLTPQAEVADAPAITPAPYLAFVNRDPSYAYVAKADGTFRISINDNSATMQPYELRILKETPKPASLIALNPILPGAKAKGAEIGSANIPRGGIAALEIIAPNRNALSEPIELKAVKLPAGVTCLGGFIGKGQSLGYIAFQASADAPAGASILSEIPQSHYASFAVADAARDNTLSRTTGSPALGVSTQLAPAFVQTEKTDILEVAADAKLDIALKVTRHADFTDALKLKALGLIDVAKAPEADIPAKAAAGKFTLDVKALKLAPGDYGFILQGPAKMKFRRGLEELSAAESAAKKAAEAQAAAKQQLATANADATPKKAELVKAATAALKSSDAAKATADKLVKDLAAKSAAKEATFIVYSNPIRIRVKEVAKK
ncbi:hypothetical protein [Prosthecobacter sp.]|uniref:hypothetical protein n=1 Tax=Prosthecobacter sp. TaxID=1965333 RepID=UPI00248766EC|nr:hypothetical protein [Prosthecobacter sp.]MDI1313442.1 hypothetical protein [Prosthecobacter sp.]